VIGTCGAIRPSEQHLSEVIVKRWYGSGPLLVMICVVAASGCGDDGTPVERSGGEPPIFTYDGDGGMDAIVSGRLVYLDDVQCIVLENGASREVAVFPSGSDAYLEADGTLIVEMDGFGPLREGVSITGGGGHLSADDLDLTPEPAGCSTDGMSYAVLQSISDAH
jgi:hypothetical protein